MIFKERYLIEEVKKFILSQVTHIILGKGEDGRSRYFYEFIKSDYHGKVFLLDVNVRNQNRLTIDEIINGKANPIGTGYLIKDLEKLVKHLLEGSTLCIDISGIKHPLLFLLLKVIKQVGITRLFAVYTEPKHYEKEDFDEDQYSLTEDFLGIRSVPGYAKASDWKSDFIFVPILGFEGNRFQAIFDHIQPSSDKIIPIVGFPAFKPGWKNITLAANRSILEKTGSSYEIHYCHASCPFDIYDCLKNIRSRFSSSQLLISPLGPRPLTLGCGLYLLRDNNCLLIYDNPVERKYRTKDIGKCHFYHITNLIQI